MKIRFTATSMSDFIDAIAYQLEAKKHTESEEQIVEFPSHLGAGQMRGLRLRDGLDLMLLDHELAAPLCLEGEYSGHQPLGLSFCLSGFIGYAARGAVAELGLSAYQRSLSFMPDFRHGAVFYPEKRRTVLVGIGIEPTVSKLFTDEQLDLLLGTLTHVGDSSRRRLFFQTRETTPAMQTVLTQALHCPYRDKTRHLYLESKALELVALTFAQIGVEGKNSSSRPLLRPDDVARIHHARDILVDNMDEPPSLLALARQVGLNDFKLKAGFRQVFGTTAFGYLHDQRMERARQLLEERRFNVTEIACTVGYANPSHFSAAFKRKFGVNPRGYVADALRGQA
jgi:AraC-like DNA-binding protein